MRRGDMIRGVILIIIIIFFAANVNSINSFLSVNTDRTVEFGHSATIVPQAWNTTDELNLTNESKTPHAITNEYVYIDHWDDWPEDHITSKLKMPLQVVFLFQNSISQIHQKIQIHPGIILVLIMFSLEKIQIMQFKCIISHHMITTIQHF